MKEGVHLLIKINKKSTCHPELVELPPSEERGESASQQAKRDLVTNLGGLFKGCYIDTESHQNMFGDPFVAVAPRFFLAIRSKKVRLRSG